MSEIVTGLFHCARCGNFFKGPIGPAVVRRCPECGGDPAVSLDDRRVRKVTAEGTIVRGISAGPEGQEESGEAPDPSPTHRHRSRHRRDKDQSVLRLVVFLALWVGVLGVFAAAMMMKNQRREREEQSRAEKYRATRIVAQDPLAMNLSATERDLIEEAFPACRTALIGFLQSPSPEIRSQWVCEPLRILGALSRFDQSSTAYQADQAPTNEFLGVLQTPAGKMIETLWKSPDGARIEAVFRRDQEGWRLDWESFVRYSETPWVMFLAGGGKPVQEFRLLARERLAEERRQEPTLSVVFHPPRFGDPAEAGPASPEFLVRRLSDPGRKLTALFELARAGQTPFNAKAPTQDPEEMIRVRVRIRRIDDAAASRKFEVEDVLAGHWLGIEDGGIPDPSDPGGNPVPTPASGG
jgi:hypothetical protein